MKRIFVITCLFIWVVSCQKQTSSHIEPNYIPSANRPSLISYGMELKAEATDEFWVVVDLPLLGPEDNIFQFVATAPGTYQTMNIGRYVRDFVVIDQTGSRLAYEQDGNQFLLKQPEKARQIRYTIRETWDTPVTRYPVYKMAGTTVEADHAMICPHGIFGFFPNRQNDPLSLSLRFPNSWEVGTALTKVDTITESSYRQVDYSADNFDHFVDSPILVGDLDFQEVQVDDCLFQVYTYSSSGKAYAQPIIDEIRDELDALKAFLKDFPINQYVFLFHFEEDTVGAWEHSYSSNYVLSDANFEQLLTTKIPHFVNHETFHMVTPLNIRSEKIVPYNFVDPQPTMHIWFYEGVTEWASTMMNLRNGVIDLETYLKDMRQKLFYSNFLPRDLSLTEMGLQSFSQKGQQAFGNFYMKGALSAMLLDIIILDHFEGQRGLREVILELLQEYGPNKSFQESEFFDIIEAKTFAGAKTYLENHVQGNEDLPFKDVMAKVGVEFTSSQDFKIMEDCTESQKALRMAWMHNL